MAGESIDVLGTFTTCLTAASVADGAMSGQSSSITATLGATEAAYSLIDIQVDVQTANTAGATIDIYRRPSDGTNAQPAPTVAFKRDYVGTVTLSGAAAKYYVRYVPTGDPNDTFYALNNDSAARTIGLAIRGRAYKAAG